MNKTITLNELISQATVDWMPLGSIGEFVRGNGMQKKDLAAEGFPAIHYGQIHTKYGTSAERTFSFVSPELAEKLRKARTNDLLLATTSENDDDVAKPLAWLGKEAAISGDMMLFRHQQNAKYLAYVVQTEAFQREKNKIVSGTKVRRAASGDLAKISVPIPCSEDPQKSLAIQTEIAHVLDTFAAKTSELSDGLSSELSARKKQYDYYKELLLGFDEGSVQWKPMSDVATLRRGRVMSREYLAENPGPFPVYSSQTANNGVMGSIRTFDFDGEFISWTTDGANAGTVFYRDGRFSITNVCGLIRVDQRQLNCKYLFYWLSVEAKKHVYAGMGNPKLMSHQMEQIQVPIPYPDDPEKSLAEQARIVMMLDRIEAASYALQEGLPHEIELRQKQYAYYRDLLLSFGKAEERAA